MTSGTVTKKVPANFRYSELASAYTFLSFIGHMGTCKYIFF